MISPSIAIGGILPTPALRCGLRSSSAGTPSTSKSITSLEAMGVRVFGLDEPLVGNANEEVTWDTIAGYDQQKRYLKFRALTACLVEDRRLLRDI